MAQSSRAMKCLGYLSIMLAAGFSCLAQDTNLLTLSTNLPDSVDELYAQITNSPFAADTSLKVGVRPMSLQDCIAMALEHNFTVQIARFTPAVARYTLAGSYGAYDPTFTSSYNHQYSLAPGGLDQQGRAFSGSETESDSFNSGLAGYLPWGLNYNLGVSANDRTVKRPSFLATTNITGYSTNIFYDTSTNPVVFLNPKFATIPGILTTETTSANAAALTLNQPLLRNFWIDADRFTIYMNKKELQKSEADFRDTLMSTITQVETAYLRLVQADENVIVQMKALELAERTLAENKRRVQVGAMAPLDEQQAEAAAASSRSDLLRAQAAEGTQQRVLKSLLTDKYTNEWMNVVIQPKDKLLAIPQDLNLQESWRRALAQGGSPVRLQQLRLTLQENEARVRLQKNQLFPELDVTGTYGYSGTGREYSDAFGQIQNRTAPAWSIGAQMSIPLTQTAARNNLKSAKASRDQQALTLKLQEQNTMISVENDVANIRSDYDSVQSTHAARLYAEAALEAEQKKYENGKSTLFDILGLQSKLTAARFQEVAALANYNVDIATLSYDEGSTFERLKVDLKLQ